MAEKPKETWSLGRIIVLLVIALLFVYVAGQLGILAKIGINFGPVQFELQGVQANSAPQTGGSSGSPNANSSQPGVPYSASTQCPQRQNWYNLPYASVWWGPVNGSYVLYDQVGAFWTWDAEKRLLEV